MTTPIVFYACFGFSYFFGKKMLPDAQAPQSLCSCPATTSNHSAISPTLLRSRLCGLLRKNSKILESINDFLKKQASKLLSCRGGLGEAPYNTPRHSLQRCRSKALKDAGIRKLTLFEFSYLNVLKVF